MKAPDYEFLRRAGRILNSGQARTLVITGNIHDVFHSTEGDEKSRYVSLLDFLLHRWDVTGKLVLVYEINGPVRFRRDTDREKLRNAWVRWQTGMEEGEAVLRDMVRSTPKGFGVDKLTDSFDKNLENSVGRPTVALELLRQFCLCSRAEVKGKPALDEDLIILVEGADLILPQGDIIQLPESDRHRVGICRDWFSDPGFLDGGDSVVLLSESRSMLNDRVAKLPFLLDVTVPSPDMDARRHFIQWFQSTLEDEKKVKLFGSQKDLAMTTAGLSLQALLQLLKGAAHAGEKLDVVEVVSKVEEYIQSQVGEEVIEFKKPFHTLKDVVGFTALKDFLHRELIPRFQSDGADALPGAAVCGPIGAGKTFIFEAMAAELDMVVLVLKNIRSQWYGQTDVIFERLRRVLEALNKVVIFVDEADTQFGGVGAESHSTERRLTGKIQAMMSDPRLRGKVIWLLMTARIHLLSPDIRRPGRVGDLIIPILDPQGDDRRAFLAWMVTSPMGRKPDDAELDELERVTAGFSAAGFASLRSELKAGAVKDKLTLEKVVELIHDRIPPAIEETRRYQELQALTNCTRRSLMPDVDDLEKAREQWRLEMQHLESRGIH